MFLHNLYFSPNTLIVISSLDKCNASPGGCESYRRALLMLKKKKRYHNAYFKPPCEAVK